MSNDNLPMFASNRPEKGETVASEINKLFGIMRKKLRETPNIAILWGIRPALASVLPPRLLTC